MIADRFRLLATGVCATLALSGCAAAPGAQTTAPSPSANKHGAPVLTQPELDTAQFVPDPCRLLAAPQLAQLGITVSGQPEDSPLGKACRWVATDTAAKVDFSLDINTQIGGLDQLYGRKNVFRVWQPLEISGYPAVIADEAGKPFGQCRTNVAVSNTVLVATGLQLKAGLDKPTDFDDPCPRGVKILEQVIRTLQGGR
ncbi:MULTISPECIES: DUF3558 domain-containing protein [unclassified Crossiella]|uniref:DUF3558 domain-containing protein n=1 Tax=unclassified Crossiella TaxID=2620835 RepID=UPI001FFE8BCA|nr:MULTISPECIES: DUF3558 domain-containing protein [unclassified Crossiella]MCK2243986.1 DUF3558 domain-containing protein [Crossiella sp. S99.2]MCK2257156.1 DUF3558 domain-containing protein [Crossiella sp. S99.1]